MAAKKPESKPESKPVSKPVITTEERAYATRYKQGGRTVYGLTLSPAQLINMVPRPDPSIPNPGNRAIRENHAKQFADYYLSHDDWVSPALILRAPAIFTFEDQGIIAYEKRHAARIQILDGQHRILGFHIASALLAQREEKALDHRARVVKVEGSKSTPALRDADAELAEVRRLQTRLDSEQVSVEIHVTDDTAQYRQMFFDIAENALGITASVKARFDTRKVVNRALPLVLEHPLFENRVDLENDRVKRSSVHYATARHVGDIIRATRVGVDGRIGKQTERTLDERALAAGTKDFLDLALQAFPQLQALTIGQVSAQTLRDTSLIGSPPFLRVLGGIYFQLLSDKHQWSRDDVREYFTALEPHMLGGAHAASIWMRVEAVDAAGNRQKVFTEGAFSPNGRRQDLAALEKTLVEWAILGKKGAPWVWKTPAAPPVRLTEDEEVLEAEIAADPVLGELLAAQEERRKNQ